MKEISFEHEGKSYTLAFTRRSVERLEQSGFRIGDMSDAPSLIPVFFHGAFLHKHPMIKQAVTDRILLKFTDKDKLWRLLTEMYSDTVNSILGDPDEDDAGNVTWEANWEPDEE